MIQEGQKDWQMEKEDSEWKQRGSGNWGGEGQWGGGCGLVPIYHCDSWPGGRPWDLTSPSLIFFLFPSCLLFSTSLSSPPVVLLFHCFSVGSLMGSLLFLISFFPVQLYFSPFWLIVNVVEKVSWVKKKKKKMLEKRNWKLFLFLLDKKLKLIFIHEESQFLN